MPTLRVTPVDYGAPAFQAFLLLPWKCNRQDPNWVPPLLVQQKSVLNPRKGPFFEHGEAQYFVAWRGDEPVGRLSAHVNHAYEAVHDTRTGFFGFFECEDNQETADALLDAAAAWLAARGKTRIQGPMGFGIYDEVGCLVSGFEIFPAIMQVQNPPCYQRLLEGWGLEKAVDWVALGGVPQQSEREKMAKGLEEALAKNGDLVMRRPKPREILQRVEEVRQMFNDTWSENWGHVPFSPRHFKNVLAELRPMLRTRYMQAFYNENNEMVAFAITIPDCNRALQAMDGRLGVRGVMRLVREGWLKPPSRVRTVILGVRRDYQRRMLHAALIGANYLQMLDTPSLEWWDMSLIVETNKPVIRLAKYYKAPISKVWRIYQKELDAPSAA